MKATIGYLLLTMGGGGGGRQGFMDRGFWTKLGMDYGFLTFSPLECGFEMVSG